jgi:hypothetical protein
MVLRLVANDSQYIRGVGAGDRFLGIADYQPQHVHTIAELSGQRDRLRSLVGTTFDGPLAMWDTDDDEWFTDGPLILRFPHARLELAAFQVHMCVSWDSIDVEDPIEWIPGSTFQLAWRDGRPEPLEALRGRPLDELVLLEYRGAFHGLGLRAGDRYAEVFNAFDELGVSDAVDDDPELIRTPL